MNILILVGISGAGKSTWAHEFLKANQDYICINRDGLRLALTKETHKFHERADAPALEVIINRLTDCIIDQARQNGYNILVDNTNLTHRNITKFFNIAGYKPQIKIFDIRPELAKVRVSLRGGVPVEDLHYIDQHAKQYEHIKEYILTNHKDKLI